MEWRGMECGGMEVMEAKGRAGTRLYGRDERQQGGWEDGSRMERKWKLLKVGQGSGEVVVRFPSTLRFQGGRLEGYEFPPAELYEQTADSNPALWTAPDCFLHLAWFMSGLN